MVLRRVAFLLFVGIVTLSSAIEASQERNLADVAASATTAPCEDYANTCFDDAQCYTCMSQKNDIIDHESELKVTLTDCSEDTWFNYMASTYSCNTDNFATIDYGHCLWMNYVAAENGCSTSTTSKSGATSFAAAGTCTAVLAGIAGVAATLLA